MNCTKILTLLFCLLVANLHAQDAETDKAIALEEKGDYTAANAIWEKLAQSNKQAEDWTAYLNAGVNRAENLLNLGAYQELIELSQRYLKETKGKFEKPIREQAELYSLIGKGYYMQQDNLIALDAMKSSARIKEQIDPNDPTLFKDYANIGIINGALENNEIAITYLEKAIKLNNSQQGLIIILITLSSNQLALGYYGEALQNVEQAMVLDRQGAYQDQTYLLNGKILNALGDHKEAIKQLKIGQKLFSDKGDNINKVTAINVTVGAYIAGADQYQDRSMIDSAVYYANLSYDLSQMIFDENDLTRLTAAQLLAGTYMETNQLELALSLLEENKSNPALSDYPLLLIQYSSLESRVFLKQGKHEQALNSLQKGIGVLVEGYKPKNIYDLPSLELAKASFNIDELTNALARKARYLYIYYQQANQDSQVLEAALETMELFDQLVDDMRKQLTGKKMRWGDMTLDAYENAIEICLALHKATDKEDYKHKAFFYAEKSRSLSLLESLQDAKASKMSGLPDDLLKKAKTLDLEISDLEQLIFQLEQRKKKDQARIDELKKERFAKLEERKAFFEQLEQDYPKYYEMKYGVSFADVKQVREMLAPEQAMLEYFVGDSSVYVFKITQQEFEVVDLGPMPNLLEQVSDFRNSISGYFLKSSDRNEQIYVKYAKDYVENAYALYQQLLAPVGTLPKRLLIVPAGPLGNMPFEPLLTKAAEDPKLFNQHDYLIKTHIPSYCYSATLLREMRNRQHKKVSGTYLGFAPEFGESAVSVVRGKRYKLSPLVFNAPEIEGISELLGGGTIYKGKEAIEERFKAEGANYSIVHFATHGMANDEHPDFSLLAFTEIKDSVENEFLYIRDLYNMELNADLVVLSACETGVGKLHRAEGVISLARGFSYAGAKSIFTTLWSVNDQATYKIVEGFYKNLQAGKPKDEALQLAKLDFIERGQATTAHPFLWSPYIMVGDVRPIESISTSSMWIYYGLGAVAVVVLGLGVMRMARKREV